MILTVVKVAEADSSKTFKPPMSFCLAPAKTRLTASFTPPSDNASSRAALIAFSNASCRTLNGRSVFTEGLPSACSVTCWVEASSASLNFWVNLKDRSGPGRTTSLRRAESLILPDSHSSEGPDLS